MKVERALFLDLYDTLMHVTERQQAYAELLDILCNYGGLEPGEIRQTRTAYKLAFMMEKTSSDIVGSLMKLDYFNDRPYFMSILEDLSEHKREDLRVRVEKEVDSVRAFNNAEAVLERLSKKYELVLISNLASPFKKPFTESALPQYFSYAAFSCDEWSVKPDRHIYEVALKNCSIKDRSKIMMIGDKDHTDGRGAQEMGLHFLRSKGNPGFLNEIEQFLL